jgi:hypothetical protein
MPQKPVLMTQLVMPAAINRDMKLKLPFCHETGIFNLAAFKKFHQKKYLRGRLKMSPVMWGVRPDKKGGCYESRINRNY